MADEDLAVLDSDSTTEDGKVPDSEIEETEKALSEDGDDSSEETGETSDEDEQTTEDDEEETQEDTEEPKDQPPSALVSALKGKYPDFFKSPEGKAVRAAIYNANQYNQYFTNPEEAKDSIGRLNLFQNLSSHLLQGSVDSLLHTVGQTDGRALTKIAENILPSLAKINEGLYFRAAIPIVKSALESARRDAEASGNKNLKNSVHWLSKYIFNTEDGSIPEDRKPINDPEKEQLKQQVQAREQQDYQDFDYDLNTSAWDTLSTELNNELDPKIPDFVRHAFINRVISEANEEVAKDNTHMSRMRNLRTQARASGYSPKISTQIVQGYISRMRPFMSQIKNKYKAELNGRKYNTTKKQFPASGAPRTNPGRYSPKDVDYRKTSDMDILMDKPTLKGSK